MNCNYDTINFKLNLIEIPKLSNKLVLLYKTQLCTKILFIYNLLCVFEIETEVLNVRNI